MTRDLPWNKNVSEGVKRWKKCGFLHEKQEKRGTLRVPGAAMPGESPFFPPKWE